MRLRAAWAATAPLRSHPRFRALAFAAALALLAATLFGPPLRIERAAFDGVVVFDITQSMNVPDYRLDGQPASRLAFAKARVREALGRLPCGSKMGFGIFTEHRTTFLTLPVEVCANYGELAATLERIDGRMAWVAASEIFRGLYSALRLSSDKPPHPAVVFVTDGHEAPAPKPGWEHPPFAHEAGSVTGAVVGVGGDQDRPIPKVDPFGRSLGEWGPQDFAGPGPSPRDPGASGAPRAAPEYLSSLHEPYLMALARDAGLPYARLRQDTDFASILAMPGVTHRLAVQVVARPWCLAGALLLTLLGLGARRPVRAARPAPRKSPDEAPQLQSSMS